MKPHEIPIYLYAPTGVQIPTALIRRSELSAGAKLLWGCMTMMAGDGGICPDCRETMATNCGWSLDCVSRSLAELVKAELIRMTDDGSWVFIWQDFLAESLGPETETAHGASGDALCECASS